MEPRGRCHMRMDAETVIREANPVKLIMFINQIHRRKIEKLLDGTGLHRAQHRMLMTLSDCPVTSQVELANILEVSAAKDLTKSSWRCFKAYWGRCTAMRRI